MAAPPAHTRRDHRSPRPLSASAQQQDCDGGLSEDGSRWISSRPGFLVHVNVLSRLFSGRFLTMLSKAHTQGRLNFFGDHAALTDRRAFSRFLAPLRKIEWVVYTKNPFAGPKQVLRYLSRYTHRVAISNRRLVSTDNNRVAFRWKDYRIDSIPHPRPA